MKEPLLVRVTRGLFLATIASIPFMTVNKKALGSVVTATDALFALTFGGFALCVVTRQLPLRRGRFYLPLVAYLGAMLLATAFAPERRVGRLAIEGYLMALGVLTYHLARGPRHLERAWIVWSASAALNSILILATVILFYGAGIKDPKRNPILWNAGSLPIGDYPRVKGLFLNANMTGAYLATSVCVALGLALVLPPERRRPAFVAAGLCGAAALFTYSTALGGLAIAVGLFAWLWRREVGKPRSFRLALPGAALFAAALLFVTAAYPKVENGAFAGLTASPRWLTWTTSFQTMSAHPLFGKGLGADLADVKFMTSRGVMERLTDPHNAWLSVGGQTGLVGLAAFVLLVATLARGFRGMTVTGPRPAVERTALMGALIVFLYQSFSASLEDVRHVWVVFGMLAASLSTPPDEQPAGEKGAESAEAPAVSP